MPRLLSFCLLTLLCIQMTAQSADEKPVLPAMPKMEIPARQHAHDRETTCLYDSIHYYLNQWTTDTYFDFWMRYFLYNQSGLMSRDSTINFSNPGGTSTNYTYDGNGLETMRIIRSLEDVGWIDQTKLEFEYDAQDREILETRKVWSENDWQNLDRTETEYNDAGLISALTIMTWNIDVWENAIRVEYEYNDTGLLTAEYHKLWANGIFNDDEKMLATYNSNGYMLSLEEEYHNGIEWIKVSRREMEYNTDDMLTVLIKQDGVNNEWVNDTKSTFAYNPDQTLSYGNEYEWVDSDWSSSMYHGFVEGENNGNWTIVTYNYLNETDLILQDSIYLEVLGQINNWYTDLQDRIRIYESKYSMDSSNWALSYQYYNPVCEDECFAYNIYSTSTYTSTKDYYCAGFVGNEEVEQPMPSTFQVYPNPSNGQFIIQHGMDNISAEATLYDISGRICERKTITQQQFDWDTNLPSGVYLLRIKVEGDKSREQTMRIVIE